VTDGYADLGTALAGIELDSANVIGVTTDILFPLHQQKAIAEALSGNGIETEFEALPSVMGHDAFLVDYKLFVPLIDSYFKRIRQRDNLD